MVVLMLVADERLSSDDVQMTSLPGMIKTSGFAGSSAEITKREREKQDLDLISKAHTSAIKEFMHYMPFMDLD